MAVLNWIISRRKSASPPFSASSVNAILALVVIVVLVAKLKVSQPNLTQKSR